MSDQPVVGTDVGNQQQQPKKGKQRKNQVATQQQQVKNGTVRPSQNPQNKKGGSSDKFTIEDGRKEGTKESAPSFMKMIHSKLRSNKKKLEKIATVESKIAQGKEVNSDQRELLSRKSETQRLIDELEEIKEEFLQEERRAAQAQEEVTLSPFSLWGPR